MLKVCDLLAIFFSIHNEKTALTANYVSCVHKYVFESSRGIFIVCNMDRDPIMLVQRKVALNRNLFSLLNIIKGPPDLQLEEYNIKKNMEGGIRFQGKP